MDIQFVTGNGSNRPAENCLDFVDYLNRDLHPYETLSLLVPTDDRVWTEKTPRWHILFKIMIALLAIIYLAVGTISVILLVRRDCLRLGTRTFFAVYLSMAILGFSRGTLFALDPYGILGYISNQFPAWIIMSRFLAAAGFPSLVAACTLIILTLFKLVNAKPGKQWYQKWTHVIPLLIIPYTPAVIAEALGHINTYAAIFSGLVCETFFVLWGLSICISYLCAGTRLLKTLKSFHRKATQVVDRRSTAERSGNISTDQFKTHDEKTKRIARKIIIITFGTAITGVLYSLASAGVVVMILLLTFLDCMGFENRTSSASWLGIQFANFVTEIMFAGLILYSISDFSLLLSFFKFLLSCQFCRGNKTPETTQDTMQDPEAALQGEDGDGGTLTLENHSGEDQLENRYRLATQNNSDSSIESADPQDTSGNEPHDARAEPNPGSRKRRPSKPLDLNAVSRVLSIPETPPQFNMLWSAPKLKKTQGSEPSMEGDLPLLRHCKSYTPTKHRKVAFEPLSMPQLELYGSLPLKPFEELATT